MRLRRRGSSDPSPKNARPPGPADASGDAKAVGRRRTRRFRSQIDLLLARSSGRILAGPWLGELGWEVLYWIPLLRWCVQGQPELRERLVVVSRGGVGGWYEGVAQNYVDLSEAYDAKEYTRRLDAERRARRARGENALKQKGDSEWEREIAAWVGERFGEATLPMLHPSILAYAGAQNPPIPGSPVADSEQVVAQWRRPERGPLEAVLPERYVATRFYESRLLKGEGGSRFSEAATRFLAERIPVVTLSPGMETDPQHPDFEPGTDVIRLAPHASFANNLELQSIAIANATAFVGTFGGLAFVPPHYGVPSICFWSATRHGGPDSLQGPWRDLERANRIFNRPGWGGFSARRSDEAPLDELLAPVLAAATA